MRKKHLLFQLVLLTILPSFAKAQCPTSAFDLLSQSQVNAFATNYPSCTIIPDGVDIKIMGSDITDLSPLSQLIASEAVLEIRDCPLLVDLDGLENLTYLGNDPLDGFILRDLPLLEDITALSSLDSVEGEFTIRTCNSITSLNGLNGLQKAKGSLIIRDNANLENLNGLEALTYIGETLELVGNGQLTDISSLSNVNTIVGGVEGGVFIEANDILTNLTGLGNNTTIIGSNLDLLLNGDLSLCSVPSICNYLANPPLGAVITITGNLTGCNTVQEIQAGCATNDITELSTVESIIFPNPFSEAFILILNASGNRQVIITDVSGKILVSDQVSTTMVGLGHFLPTGIYFLKIESPEGTAEIHKIIKL